MSDGRETPSTERRIHPGRDRRADRVRQPRSGRRQIRDTLAARIAAAGHSSSARAIVKDDVAADPPHMRAMAEARRHRRDHIDRRHRPDRPRCDHRSHARAFSRRRSTASASLSTWCPSARSAPRPCSRARPPASPRANIIFCLPGSPGACRDGWEDILEDQLDYRHSPAISSRSCRGLKSTCGAARTRRLALERLGS